MLLLSYLFLPVVSYGNNSNIWVFLAASSNGWDNYRHQVSELPEIIQHVSNYDVMYIDRVRVTVDSRIPLIDAIVRSELRPGQENLDRHFCCLTT